MVGSGSRRDLVHASRWIAAERVHRGMLSGQRRLIDDHRHLRAHQVLHFLRRAGDDGAAAEHLVGQVAHEGHDHRDDDDRLRLLQVVLDQGDHAAR